MSICKSKKSFTLIELLVVIAVIGVLSSVVMVNLSGSRTKAKVAKGLEFSQSVQHAIGSEAVGIWNLDEGTGTTANDVSGYGNNGTISGASYSTSTPQSIVGSGQGKYALSFDGTDDYVDCGSGTSLDITGAITIEAWVKPTGTTNRGGIVNRWLISGDDRGGYILSLAENNVIRFAFGRTGGYDYKQTTDTINTSWHHIAGTRTGTTVKIYVDGTEVSAEGNISSDWDPAPGTINYISAAPWSRFNGLIDEVRIYGTALTLGQIQQHYAEGLENHQQLTIQ